jgi:hypothetical protein
MIRDYPKSIRKALREWAVEAHERELHRELTLLDRSFDEWRAGQIGSGELSDRIHEFHNGPARELFSRYNGGYQDMNVAAALVVGILTREEVPAEVVRAIADLVQFIEPPGQS